VTPDPNTIEFVRIVQQLRALPGTVFAVAYSPTDEGALMIFGPNGEQLKVVDSEAQITLSKKSIAISCDDHRMEITSEATTLDGEIIHVAQRAADCATTI
jgi:hypothetical protein